ncbi:MAG TPA: transcriptional regulator NrdR [Candidatus Nanoarchaeia archaeon]|nr:transcriptional regulator NrdR [Candidatus Nanoarchaeia archaeon]
MYCPYCSHAETKVLESRLLDSSFRRRRECLKCSNRFTTYETAEFSLKVLKKSGQEEAFNLQKIHNSIQKACSKTNPETVAALTGNVQKKILNKKMNLIKSADIGKFVLQELKKFDKIAYLRFASVYKAIEDPKILEKEINLIS